jgi:hypothetical protein
LQYNTPYRKQLHLQRVINVSFIVIFGINYTVLRGKKQEYVLCRQAVIFASGFKPFSPSALNYRFTEKRVLQSFLKIFKICVDETALL